MKQIGFTLTVPVTRAQRDALERELYGQTRLERAADKLCAALTAAVGLIAVVLAVIGLGGRPCAAAQAGQTDGQPEIASATVTSVLEEVESAWPEQERHACVFSGKTHAWDTPLTESELTALLSACEAGHIDPSVGLGLIQAESGFDPDAVNPAGGCYGYCQLNPMYFPAGLSPEENIRTGIAYLAQQLERYGDLEAALTAYNAGYDTGSRTYASRVLTMAEGWSE